MSHGHGHGGPIQIGPTASRVVIGLLVVIGMVVVAAAVALWPDKNTIPVPLPPFQNADGSSVETEAGTVTMQDLATAEVPLPEGYSSVPPATAAYLRLPVPAKYRRYRIRAECRNEDIARGHSGRRSAGPSRG